MQMKIAMSYLSLSTYPLEQLKLKIAIMPYADKNAEKPNLSYFAG